MDLRKALGLEPGQEQLEENVVTYEIFAACEEDSAAGGDEGLRLLLLDHLLPAINKYIWQRGRFDLHLTRLQPPPWQRDSGEARSKSRRGPAAAAGTCAADTPAGPQDVEPTLWGSVEFGDNLEDEWFVVWLLWELTKVFPVTARVWDNDGDFLLIEAAYSLPRWLKPESATNRVWIHGGSLHIVPLPRAGQSLAIPPNPTRSQALELVKGEALDTQASPKALAPILQRLAGFPGKAQQERHCSRVIVPARVAHLLGREPALAAPAIEAFHYRGVDDMRAAARMAVFPPEDLVPLRAELTRCLYAQLALQEFHPLRTYPMPLPSEPQYKAAEVGMKLTAGFEMMAADTERWGQPPASEADAAQEVPNEGSLPCGPGWESFLAQLEGCGQLAKHPPGSPEQTGLLQQAAVRYGRVQQYRRRAAALAAPALLVQELLQEPLPPLDSYPPFEALPPDDNEAWLHEGAAELEAELQRRQAEMEAGPGGAGHPAGPPGSAGAEGFDPGALASRMRAFVEATAGLEGAEVPRQAGAGAAAGAAGGGGGGGYDERGAGALGGLSLNEAKFAEELGRVLGLSPGEMGAAFAGDGDSYDGESSSDEGSSFYSGGSDESSGDESGDESEGEPSGRPTHSYRRPGAEAAGGLAGREGLAVGGSKAAPAAPAAAAARGADMAAGERWEVATATDSDDEIASRGSQGSMQEGEEEGEEEDLGDFMDAYSRAMQTQLASTTLGRTFVRAGQVSGSSGGGSGGEVQPHGGATQAAGVAAAAGAAGGVASAAGGGGEGREAAGAAAEELEPVDIDLNVVEGLLASYHSQQGLPGPASSLAGLLGILLPPPPPPQQQQQQQQQQRPGTGT